jgi:hypothetical protein
MTLPVVDVLIRPDSTFAVSGTGILGTITLGAGFLLGAPAISMVSIANATTQISIRRGRTRATDSFDSGSATVSFVDTTGQFNPDNTGSNLYPYVLPLRQFRISATVGSTSYQLFNGYTTKYTYQFDPGVNAIFVTIEAEDAFRTLSMSSLETVATAAYAESSGARITKILTQLGIPNSIRSISAGNTQVADDPDTVRTGLEAVQQVEEAELGAFFIDKNGFYKYFSRQDLQLLAGGSTKPAIVFNETTGIPYEGVQIAFDDEQILNFITVDGELLIGTEVSDATSIQNYFNRTLNKTNSLLITDAEALDQANYLLGGRKDPKVTIDSIDLNVSGMATTSRTNLLTNPSFGTNTNNWTSAQVGFVRTTDFAYTGVASMKVTCKNALDNNIAVTTPTASTTGNHTFSMYVYIPTGSSLAGRTVSLSVEGGTATVSAVSQTNATLVAGSWVRLSTTKNVTATGTLVLVARLSGSMSALLTRTNLISNPSFETNTNSWAGQNGATLSRNTVAPYSGSGDLLVTSSASNYNLAISDFMTVTPNKPYYLSAYCRNVSGSTRNIYIGVQFFTSANVYISEMNSAGSGNLTTAAGWVRRSASGTSPATAAKAKVFLTSGTTGLTAGWQTEFDDILFEQSSTLNSYFDGSRTGASWTGAANNSTSTLPARVNLAPNPSFETNTTSWSPYLSSLTRVAGTITGGTGSFSAISVASGTASYGPFFQFFTPNIPPVGSTLTVSAYCLRTVGARSYRFNIQFYNSGAFISQVVGTANACATSTRLSTTATVPATCTQILIILSSTGSGAIGDSHQIDSVMLEESATVNSYFDGSTNDETSWVGTVNNSASIYGVSNIYVDSALFEKSSTADTYFDGSVSPRGLTSWTGTAHGSTSTMLSDAESVVNAELLDPVTVTKNYAGGTISKTLTIQGINHSITPGNWEMSLELAEPVGGDGLVLDSQNQGILNTNILVY